MIVLQQLINGLQVGSIYALIALGYSMVYGIIRLLNFAHGDIIMVGGYIALLIISAHVSPVIAVLAAIVGCIVMAVCFLTSPKKTDTAVAQESETAQDLQKPAEAQIMETENKDAILVEAEPAEAPAKRGRKPATKPAEEVVVVDLEKAA